MKGLLKTIACFLFTVAISFGVFANNAFAGDFSQSCSVPHVSASELCAHCYTRDHQFNYTCIDLNYYIENLDGNLVWQPDNFIETCKETYLSGESIMNAKCEKIDGSLNQADIDLDEHIANDDGNLVYEP
ncbi:MULTISPECIES: CVNH domain-containing protein [Moorena]|nr:MULTISPECIES: CVNH domain-containing protein [Moorena]NEQ13538.1 cyanovirin [Moorena sp. SIO3E2]NEP37452.1 cyanovirin [Moorena sp. SIO3B2]NEP68379.1 cyanovirin [Moorena sp. SIO3A5]NER86211.1 cyanovirin [Moorena sp. SIO3A2]NES40284.1 cyanovirin [Moorena sp. SIO2C4]